MTLANKKSIVGNGNHYSHSWKYRESPLHSLFTCANNNRNIKAKQEVK